MEILLSMNENKKEHIFTKTDSAGNIIAVTNRMEESASEEEIQHIISKGRVPEYTQYAKNTFEEEWDERISIKSSRKGVFHETVTLGKMYYYFYDNDCNPFFLHCLRQ